jgi:hypothetical protein
MITRRGFLGSILALGSAPAIVRADSLMRVVPRDLTLLLSPAERLAMNDLAWAGAIREWSAFDIVTDTLITRLDVIVATPDGRREQFGVDFRVPDGEADPKRHREPALAVLKRHAAQCGRPITGVLKLPTDFQEARFL